MQIKGESVNMPPLSDEGLSKLGDERLWALLDTLNGLLTAVAAERSLKKSKPKARRMAKSSGASPQDVLSNRDGHHNRRFSMSAATDAKTLAQLLGVDAADTDRLFSKALVTAQADRKVVKGTEPPEAKCPGPTATSSTGTPSTKSSSSGSEKCEEPTKTVYRRTRRGQKPKPREPKSKHRRRRRRGTPGAPKPKRVKAKVSSFFEAEEIEGTGYHLVLRLSGDQIMAHRRGHFEYWRRPRIEVRDNKTSEYRESYSGYCGRYPKLKTWLYYT